MTKTDIRQDLDYVANALRQTERNSGIPAIYFMWAAIVAVGFALPDFAPQIAGPYWFVFGIGGGLLSWWLGARESRRSGHNDIALATRMGQHWMIGGAGFTICWLPALSGNVPMAAITGNFLLVGGLVYSLAGVHLLRPLLWSGLLMLAAFIVLSLFALPYTWTITGVVIGLSLLWAGISSGRQRLPALQ